MPKVKVQFNPVFKPVHRCNKRYIVMKGSAGSGKSVDTAQMYVLRLMKDKGRNLVCVRKSDVTNRDSTFAEIENAINRLGVSTAWKVTQNPLSFTCINGNKIIFRGVNDNKQREKLKSITFAQGKLTDVWIEEATELVQQDLEIIDDRLRGELPEGLFYQIKMTFNPVSSSHWIKKAFFDHQDKNAMTHQSTYLDNRFCDEAYRERMERRKELDPEGYRIYGLGEWGETGGLIFSNYRSEEFDTSPEFFYAMAIGQDFGFNHANAILTLGYKDGEIYIKGDIHRLSHVPDLSDESFGNNLSGVAIKYKLLGFEQLIKDKENYFSAGLKKRFRIYNHVLSIKSIMQTVPIHRVDVKFTHNLPANNLEVSQMIAALEGMVTPGVLLGQLDFISDPDEEARDMRKLRVEEMEETARITRRTNADPAYDDEE